METCPTTRDPAAVVRPQLAGANAAPAVTGLEEQPGGQVRYAAVYPGIDLVWYGSQRQLEYDFVVAPGADPSAIHLNVSGAERLEIDAARELLIHAGEPGRVSAGSTPRQHKPFVYQEGRGENSFGIAVGPATGEALVTGATESSDFPTANPLQPAYGGGTTDAFVTRIGSSPAAYYYVSPDSGEVQAGVPFDLTVFALDESFNVLRSYFGEIAFFSTDQQAVLPEPYTFQRTDQGVTSFAKGVTLRTPGVQELYVIDTATYQIFGIAVFEVV